MRYSLKRIMSRLIVDYKLFSLILVQTMLGIFLMHVTLTINSSMEKDFQKFIDEKRNSLVSINTSLFPVYYDEQPSYPGDTIVPYDINDYDYLKKTYINVDFAMANYSYRFISIQDDLDSRISEIFMLFVTPEFFDFYFPYSKNNEVDITSAYFGKNALNALSSSNAEELVFGVDAFTAVIDKVENSKYTLKNGDILNIKEIDSELFRSEDYLVLNSIQIHKDDLIILPIKYFSQFMENPEIVQPSLRAYFMLRFDNLHQALMYKGAILDYFKHKNGVIFDFYYDADFEAYLLRAENEQRQNKMIFAVAIVVVVLIGLGLNGVMLIVTNKRMREYAILIMLGAKKTVILFEIFLQTTIVTLCSGILGILISSFSLNRFDFFYMDLQYDFFASLTCLAISIAISLVSCVLPIIKLNSITPTKVLKSL